MKKILVTMVAIALATSGFSAAAQDQEKAEPQQKEMQQGRPGHRHSGNRPPGDIPQLTPQQKAHMMTDQMDRMLTLTDKQYQKIYKLNLKKVKEMEADSLFLGRRGMGFGPGMGPRPGMGPGGPGSRAQFERDMEKAGREFTPLSPQQMEQLKAAHEKSRVKMDKKLRKILTDEQYGKWVKAEQERLIKMQQMRQNRGQGRPHRHHRPDSTGNGLPQAPESQARPAKMVE